MNKKLRKKKNKHVSVRKIEPPQSRTRIKMVQCIECPRNNTVIRMSDCVQCEYYKDNYCTVTPIKQRIRTVSLSEPMKFNRMTFQVSSEHIQDDARNYYFLTEIMSPVKNITDCKEYTELKAKLLSGELCEQAKPDEPYIVRIKDPLVCLEKTDKDACMVCSGQGYKEVESFNTDGEWKIVYYLYEMYSYSGLADLLIDDRSFKVKLKQICGYPEQLLVVKRDNKLVVGERGSESDLESIPT